MITQNEIAGYSYFQRTEILLARLPQQSRTPERQRGATQQKGLVLTPYRVSEREASGCLLYEGKSSHVAVLLMTSMQVDAPLLRLPIPVTPHTGLTVAYDVMLDRITTEGRNRIGAVIGHLDDAAMVAVNRAMAVFLGLA